MCGGDGGGATHSHTIACYYMTASVCVFSINVCHSNGA